MWPKMLLELLPHFARLMPMADAYLNSRSERERNQQAALNNLAEEVKSGWSRFDAEHTAIAQNLEQHQRDMGQLSADIAQLRSTLEELDGRAARLEHLGERASRWFLANSIVMTALLLVLVVRAFR
jgi:chromosome segregation ATPase